MLKRILNSLGLTAGVADTEAASFDAAFGRNVSTTECHRFHQPEFVFSIGARTIEPDVALFKETLEKMVEHGERFKPGETIQIGPMVLKLESDTSGMLRLMEPDMKSMPIKFVNSVATTLLLVRRQRDTVSSVNAEAIPEFISIMQPIFIVRNALQSRMLRLTKVPFGDSGVNTWLLTDAAAKSEPSQEDVQPMSVYEALLTRPDIFDFLALPENYIVVVEKRGKFALFEDGKSVTPIKGSYLDALAHQHH
jgi:hypothetical protein